jgi:succinate dehydrogenase / fumarate reductase, membrane anchor subunit
MSHLQHPIAKARGLGAGKDGVHHWWLQRLTAVALALLTPWFLILVLGLIGSDFATARLSLAQPVTASLLLIYVLALFWHARLGLQVVIEDYFHSRLLEVGLQLAVNLVFAFAAVLSVVSIGRIVFSS